MCAQAGFEQQLAAAEAALKSHSSQGPFFLGDFGYVDLMFMPSLVRVTQAPRPAHVSVQ